MKKIKFDDLKLDQPSLHVATGKPGSGKTALLFSIADKLHEQSGKHVYVALEERDLRDLANLPDYIHQLETPSQKRRESKEAVEEIYPQDAIIITDDAHRPLHARRSMRDFNVWLDELHAQLRHDDNDFLYDTQIYRSIDKNIRERVEYTWYREQHRRSIKYAPIEERAELEVVYEVLKGKDLTVAYLDSDDYEGLVTDISLPAYWTEELSRMHRRRSPGRVVIR